MSLFLLEIFHIRRGRLCAAGHSTYMLLHFLHCISVLYCTVLYCTVLSCMLQHGAVACSHQKGLLHGSSLTMKERTLRPARPALLSTSKTIPLHGECLKKYKYCTEEAQRRRKEKLRLLHARTPSTVVRTGRL